MLNWFLIYSRWVPLPIYGRFLGFTLLIYPTKTQSELVGQASSLKRKIIGCPFLSSSSRWCYWVSVNPARENQPTEPGSGLLESEPSGSKSEASGQSATVPFGRILAAFDYMWQNLAKQYIPQKPMLTGFAYNAFVSALKWSILMFHFSH